MAIRERVNVSEPVKPPLAKTPPESEVQCLHRSWIAIGKIKCNCSHQPEVFACDNSWVLSGYCMPVLKDGTWDGPIVLPDGTKVTPSDERMKTFVPWPLKKDETPAAWQVPICNRCPQQKDPAPHIARLKRLRITGDFDSETGHCMILHVMPTASVNPDRIAVNGYGMECVVTATRETPLSELVDATDCNLLIVYGQAANIASVKECLTARPELKVWMVAHDARIKQEDIQNVWYDLPADLSDDLAQRTEAAYKTAVARIIGD